MVKEILGLTGRIAALLVILAGIRALPDTSDQALTLVMGGTTMTTLLLIAVSIIQIALAASNTGGADRVPSAGRMKVPGQTIAATQTGSTGPTARMRRSIENDLSHEGCRSARRCRSTR